MTTKEPRPVADVRITLHSLEGGEAEVEVAIDPDGPLGGAYGDEEARFAALQQLFAVIQRELGDALDALASGNDDDDDDDDADDERDSLPGM